MPTQTIGRPAAPAKQPALDFEPKAEDFAFVDIYELNRTDQIVGQPTKYLTEIFRRFFRNRWAFAFTILFVLICLIAIIVVAAPQYDPSLPVGGDGTAASYLPARPFASIQPEVVQYGTWNDYQEAVSNGTVVAGSAHLYNGSSWIWQFTIEPYKAAGLENTVSIIGTDNIGQDIWTRLWFSTGTSLGMALAVAICATVIGVIYGAVSGTFAGKAADTVMMRIVDVISGVPTIVWLIVLGVVFAGASYTGSTISNATLIPALIFINWMSPAVSTRTYILKTKDAEYVQATRTLGGSEARIIFTHMIPVIMGRLAVIFVNMIPTAIFYESSLVFLGLKSTAELGLGTMLNDAWQVTNPAQIAAPIVTFSLLTISAQIIANALNDAIDPRVVGRG